MTNRKLHLKNHPQETELAGFLSGSLESKDMARVEEHIAGCPLCLEKAVSSYESVKEFKKKNKSIKSIKDWIMKKINFYLILAIISFALSFVAQRYFLQFLVATLILGIKWVVDSKSMKMLIMIHEAWKSGGEKEASRIIEKFDRPSFRI